MMSDMEKRFDVLYALGKYEELLHVSIPLCATNDEDALVAYHATILALISQERLDEASAYVDRAIEVFPTEAHFLYFKAFIFFKRQALKQALLCVHELLRAEPNGAVYHHLHAQVLTELSRYIEAKRAIDQALVLDAHHSDYLATLALITYHLGNTPIACEIVSAILAQEPHHAQALYLKSAVCSSSLLDKKEILREILFRDPFDIRTQETLKAIKRYYRFSPILMGTFLLYAFAGYLEFLKKSEHSSGILLLLSFYVWRDWRLSLPFFGLCFVLLGDVGWHEWYVVPLGMVLFYVVGRIGGTIVVLFWDKIDFLKNAFFKKTKG